MAHDIFILSSTFPPTRTEDVGEYTGSSGSSLKCIIAGDSSLSDDRQENVNRRL